jgi:hypothetical protein
LNFLKKYRDIIYMAGLVILMLVIAKQCGLRNGDSQRISDLLEYEHIAKTYKAKDGSLVSYNTNLTVTPEDLALLGDTLLDYIANLELKIKNVHSTTVVTERLRIDTLKIPADLTSCEFDTTLQVIDSNYNMDLTITNRGLTFNTLEFPNRLGVTLASRRTKWWKAKESIVAITNSNPYMKTDGITSYTFQQNKWYQKWWVHAIEGVIAGSIATYYITK